MKASILQLYLTLIVLFATTLLEAQTPNWAWAKSAGNNGGSDYMNGISTDKDGYVYITGSYQRDSLVLDTITLHNSGLWDEIYLAKYDQNGNVQWAKDAGGILDNDVGNAVATDLNGNVYITGIFTSDTAYFGSYNLVNAGGFKSDIFIAKYDAQGNVLWARSAGGLNYDEALAIATDNFGNVYITGWYSSDSIAFGSILLPQANGRDIFLVKYDPNGNVLWANSKGTISSEEAKGITTDQSGNVYITGGYNSNSITFGNSTLINSNSNLSTDVFIAKYDSSGQEVWGKTAGGTGFDIVNSISADLYGNLFITGYYASSQFITGSLSITNTGVTDFFAVKYDSSGTPVWLNTGNGFSSDQLLSSCTDQQGNLIAAGWFNSFSLNLGTTTLTHPGGTTSSNLLIVKYGPQGNLLWASTAIGNGISICTGVATDTSDNVYTGGYFRGSTLTPGLISLSNSNPSGGDDIFFAKLGTTISGISIDEISEHSLQVFPNPFSNQLNLQLRNLPNDVIITIGNSLGQIIQTHKNINGNELILNRGEIPSGMYFVSAISNGIVITTTKVIVSDL